MAEERKRTCNRSRSIDDEGDNRATMRCQLPMGHDGPHEESYDSHKFGKVTTTFEKGAAPVLMGRLKHMVPGGRTCFFPDGRWCPFLACLDHQEGESPELDCYLSGDFFTRIWPDEYRKGCE